MTGRSHLIMDRDRALSVTAAAREHGDRPALIDADGVLDWRAAAAVVDAGDRTADDQPGRAADDAPVLARPWVAALDRATVLAIWSALEQRRPLGLLHARAKAEDHAALAARLQRTAVPADTLAVVFTSGSTGRPKGVVLSRAAAVAAATLHATHLGWRDDDRWLLALPLAHVGGLAVVVRCLVGRRPMIITDAGVDGGVLAAALADHRATLASLVPAQLDALLADPAWKPPPALRAILLGGAAAPAALLARARGRGVVVLTTYGMSETFGQVATAAPGAPPPPGAIARPLAGVTLTAGTAAEPAPIIVDSPTRMSGYLDDPSPPGPLVTTDLGYLDDGWLYVVGRADDVIITGGENVHPATVEAALLAAPGVAAACVFGLPDPRWGQLVTAAVVPSAGFEVSRALAVVADRLPDHARPRRLVVADALPLTASGKPDRPRAARELGPRARRC